ncbi:phosphoribosylglycinamide formyltransferase [Bacteriovorax stolpii]|nr:phosphoribosylglycinamide formyltransferase [Bacteriovorax stolpii]
MFIMKKIAILASGSGSNAEAIMKWAKASGLAEVVCVLSDKREARVLERAFNHNVPGLYVRKKKLESREEYDQKLIVRLADFNPDWIVLAGYMKLLTPKFLHVFRESGVRVINIHPSLLPLFPGLDGYGDAYRAGVKESGCTIHYVDEGMDTGEIIAQKTFPLIPGETLEEFKARGLLIENVFYPEILEKLLTQSL